MGSQDDESDKRDLRLDWAMDEIVDALSDELVYHLRAARLDPHTAAENVLIEKTLAEMGEDNPSVGDWLMSDEHRRLVEEAARSKAQGDQ